MEREKTFNSLYEIPDRAIRIGAELYVFQFSL